MIVEVVKVVEGVEGVEVQRSTFNVLEHRT